MALHYHTQQLIYRRLFFGHIQRERFLNGATEQVLERLRVVCEQHTACGVGQFHQRFGMLEDAGHFPPRVAHTLHRRHVHFVLGHCGLHQPTDHQRVSEC
jgi:hypothetical protein